MSNFTTQLLSYCPLFVHNVKIQLLITSYCPDYSENEICVSGWRDSVLAQLSHS